MSEKKTVKEQFREKYCKQQQVLRYYINSETCSPFVTLSVVRETFAIFDEVVDGLVAQLQAHITQIRKVHPKYMPNYASDHIEHLKSFMKMLGAEAETR